MTENFIFENQNLPYNIYFRDLTLDLLITHHVHVQYFANVLMWPALLVQLMPNLINLMHSLRIITNDKMELKMVDPTK